MPSSTKRRRSKREPEAPVFFIDRSIGKVRFAQCLRDAGIDCEVHDDVFPERTADIDWMPYCARKGLFAVSRDKRIRFNPVEQEAVSATGIHLFLVYENGRSTEEMAADFIRALPLIERFVKHNRKAGGGGFVASVLPPSKRKRLGSVNRLFPPKREK